MREVIVIGTVPDRLEKNELVRGKFTEPYMGLDADTHDVLPHGKAN
jgi:hypothetical protein